jgi:hypothetical protein
MALPNREWHKIQKDVIKIKTGLQALRESIAKQGQSTNRSANYFKWENGDKKIIRFLTDDIITANFYEYVVDARGKFQNFLYAPDVFGAGTEDFVKKYNGKTYENGTSGALIDPKQKERTVAIAVLRKEVPKPGGGGTEVVDYTEDIMVGDQKLKARWYGIVKQAHGNFWHMLNDLGMRYGTLCDRDYEIKRTGDKLDTKYSIIPLEPDPDLKDIDNLHKYYGYGKPFSPEDPNRFLNCPQTLHQWAEYYASEDRVKYFLVPAEEKSEDSASKPVAAVDDTADEAQISVPEGTEFGSSLKKLLLENK